MFKFIICLRDSGTAKSIRFDNISTRFQVLCMDSFDDIQRFGGDEATPDLGLPEIKKTEPAPPIPQVQPKAGDYPDLELADGDSRSPTIPEIHLSEMVS